MRKPLSLLFAFLLLAFSLMATAFGGDRTKPKTAPLGSPEEIRLAIGPLLAELGVFVGPQDMGDTGQ